MAKTSKIKAILTEGKWHEKSSTWFYNIVMENGDKGSNGVKEKGSLSVGQELTYNLEEDGRGGYRIKKERNTFQKAYGTIEDKKQRELGMMVGNAATNTANLVINSVIEKTDIKKTLEEVEKKLEDNIAETTNNLS